MPRRPRCGSRHVTKNAPIHAGDLNHHCRACGREFVRDPQVERIPPATREMLDARSPSGCHRPRIAGIIFVPEFYVPERWLRVYVDKGHAAW